MKFSQRNRLILEILFLILTLFIIYMAVYPLYTNQERMEIFIEESSAYSPLIIIGIIIIEVVIAPLPGFVVPIAAGFLHGTLLGSLYSWIGNVIGSAVAFALSRRYGRPFVEKIIKASKLEKYDKFLKKHHYALWIVYIFPIFPVDIISFTVGLSDTKFKKFLLVIFVGFIPNVLLLSYFGKKLFMGEIMTVIIYSLLFLLLVLLLFLLINVRDLNKVFKQLK